MPWDHIDRGVKLVGAIVGLGTIGGGIVAAMVSVSRSAAADIVGPVKFDVAVLKAILPGIDHKLDILIETEGQREWRDHRVIIPSPPSSSDGGSR